LSFEDKSPICRPDHIVSISPVWNARHAPILSLIKGENKGFAAPPFVDMAVNTSLTEQKGLRGAILWRGNCAITVLYSNCRTRTSSFVRWYSFYSCFTGRRSAVLIVLLCSSFFLVLLLRQFSCFVPPSLLFVLTRSSFVIAICYFFIFVLLRSQFSLALPSSSIFFALQNTSSIFIISSSSLLVPRSSLHVLPCSSLLSLFLDLPANIATISCWRQHLLLLPPLLLLLLLLLLLFLFSSLLFLSSSLLSLLLLLPPSSSSSYLLLLLLLIDSSSLPPLLLLDSSTSPRLGGCGVSE
jgi:hypothetical protein